MLCVKVDDQSARISGVRIRRKIGKLLIYRLSVNRLAWRDKDLRAVLLAGSIIAVLVATAAFALFVWLFVGWVVAGAFGAVLSSQPPAWAAWLLLALGACVAAACSVSAKLISWYRAQARNTSTAKSLS